MYTFFFLGNFLAGVFLSVVEICLYRNTAGVNMSNKADADSTETPRKSRKEPKDSQSSDEVSANESNVSTSESEDINKKENREINKTVGKTGVEDHSDNSLASEDEGTRDAAASPQQQLEIPILDKDAKNKPVVDGDHSADAADDVTTRQTTTKQSTTKQSTTKQATTKQHSKPEVNGWKAPKVKETNSRNDKAKEPLRSVRQVPTKKKTGSKSDPRKPTITDVSYLLGKYIIVLHVFSKSQVK